MVCLGNEGDGAWDGLKLVVVNNLHRPVDQIVAQKIVWCRFSRFSHDAASAMKHLRYLPDDIKRWLDLI